MYINVYHKYENNGFTGWYLPGEAQAGLWGPGLPHAIDAKITWLTFGFVRDLYS